MMEIMTKQKQRNYLNLKTLRFLYEGGSIRKFDRRGKEIK